MKVEKSLFRISLVALFQNFLMIAIPLNVILFVFTFLSGEPRSMIYDSSWIIQLALPLLISIVQVSTYSRNGVLLLSEYNDSSTLMKKIESILLKKGYIKVDSKPESVKYIEARKRFIFINNLFNYEVIIKPTANTVEIYSKNVILIPIESKLKYDNSYWLP